MQPPHYALVSLPLRIFDDDPMSALAATVGRDNGETLPFPVPSFKIGTLDGLVQHADDLAKLNATCEAAVAKVADSLRSILDGDEDKVSQQKMVNDSRHSASPSAPLASHRRISDMDAAHQSPQTIICALSNGTRSGTASTGRWAS